MSHSKFLSDPDDIIEEARNGRMVILVDDEERENEGDLVIPAQMATPDVINFMAKHGRGLICLALNRRRVEELGLSLMSQANQSRHQTAFTVSIEAREGISTGISAHDRARTIAVAIDESKGQTDIVSPGHVFPLVANDGGVLLRAGHTEAAVDNARLAGLYPAGVICEIMNDDGTMARMPELVEFAKEQGLRIGTIADLIEYRRRTEKLVERTLEARIDSRFGGLFKLFVYVNNVTYSEHIALVKGDISTPEPVLVRMHALNVLDDALGHTVYGASGRLHSAMQMIADEGRGVVVVIRESRATALSDAVRHMVDPGGQHNPELRDYGVGAQILLDLGVSDMILLSNTSRNIVGIEGYGLRVVDQRPLDLGIQG